MKRKLVKNLNCNKNTVEYITLSDGSKIFADSFISTLPKGDLLNLLSNSNVPLENLGVHKEIKRAPILGVHFWFDKPILEDNFLAIVQSPIQWIFNVSKNQLKEKSPYHIVISQSSAWEWIDQKASHLEKFFLNEINRILPKSRDATLLKCSIVKQKNATFRCVDNIDESRNSAFVNLKNLFIAGDWTNTGWPSTMESAVISGKKAARETKSYLSKI